MDQITSIFRKFNLDARKWIKCSIADNCNVNLVVAELLNVPHVSCANHKLNLEVSRMVRDDFRLPTVLDTVRKTKVSCNNGIRRSDTLRNINNFRISVDKNTLWSGKFTMLKRFNILRSDLIEVADTDRVALKVNRRNKFKTKCLVYEKMFKAINDVTLLLQQRGATLGECRSALDTFALNLTIQNHNCMAVCSVIISFPEQLVLVANRYSSLA